MPLAADSFVTDLVERMRNPKSSCVCVECHVPLQPTITGANPCEDGLRCDNCYFSDFGNEIEQVPVGRAATHSY